MFGRRPDGRRIKNIDPVVRITAYVMPQRCDAQIFLKHKTDMELLADYIHKQADNGEKIAVEENGTMRMKRFLPIGITADERICSGAHYAHFFADMRRYLLHPELLEQPPENVIYDEGLEYHIPKVKKPEKTAKTE